MARSNPACLLAADPSCTVGPLLEKGDRFAFHEDDLYDYCYGLANREVLNDDWCVYRGVTTSTVRRPRVQIHLGTSPLYHQG